MYDMLSLLSRDAEDKFGFIPLYCATGTGSMEVILYLLEDLAIDADACDHEGWVSRIIPQKKLYTELMSKPNLFHFLSDITPCCMQR
jgi:hypothetical protein